ncbi:MAG: N-6 DNA methylase, partial [Ruminococcus sp.]|nr:N-6 DNA methylase [Ruminococcus sp.]
LLNPKSASRAKDDLLEFEQLGFDYLVCDEAHAYKNGFVTTKMTNVSGVTTRPSGRAEDMQMKTDYFNEQFGQGHILFATGTPVSNTMTELYVMTRYLRPDLLKQAGVERFDDWAATFGNVVTKNQQTADGTLKMKTSFASFANLPELMAMYKEFADVQSADKLNLPRPELKTGKPQIISVPVTPEQKAYVHELAERAKQIENGTVEPQEDNHLKITGEARLIGLGNNAVKALYQKRGEELPYDFIDDKNSKVDKCVEKVAEIYNQTQETKGVQIIFSDIAVNSDNGNFSVYDYLKTELIAKGIPENEIIFAPKSDSKERKNIFRDINNSKYRVVIASTGTLGTGANIQQNLCALHHIDVPWKP